MAFSNIDSLNLGNILHVVFDNELFNQLSTDYSDFEYFSREKVSGSLPREFRINLQKSLGPGAIQYRNPGTTDRAFPSAHQVSSTELTIKLKEIEATIELEYNKYKRALATPEKYADPLVIELEAKSDSIKRRTAADMYMDGTGILGEISSVSVNSAVANRAVVTLQSEDSSRGHAGMFEIDEKLIDKTNAGAAGASPTISAGTFDYWIVTDRNRKDNTVTLAPVNTAGTTVNVTAWAPTAGDKLYKNGQPTFPDVSGAVSDYGTVSEALCGLESWTASDSRTVFGAAMTGAIKGSREDAGAVPIDSSAFQAVMDTVKVNVGRNRYKYKRATMAPETHAALLDARESDRRFTSVSDTSRGINGMLTFNHENDTLEMFSSEYCGPKRVFMIPDSNGSRKKVLGYVGSDFEAVDMPGSGKFYLKPGSSSNYTSMVQSFLCGTMQIICRHPAAVGVITNFTNS